MPDQKRRRKERPPLKVTFVPETGWDAAARVVARELGRQAGREWFDAMSAKKKEPDPKRDD